MTRRFLGLVPLALGLAPMAAADGPRELTVGDNGRAVEVRDGDEIRVALPSDLRNAWTWAKLTDESILGPPKNSTRSAPGSPLEVQVTTYPIRSAPARPLKVRWIYCRFGRPVSHLDNKTPLKPGDPIREGQPPAEAMIYEIELRPAPAR